MRIQAFISGLTLSRIFLLLAGAGILWSCAAIAPPSGGPKDEEPPFLVEVEPPSGTIHFKGGTTRLLFSEYLLESSVTRAVQVFPRLPEPVTVTGKGREILVSWPPQLDSSQTYILSLSRELKDEHNVPLEAALQLAYSTGADVAKGSIAGQVYGPATGVNLWRLGKGEKVDSVCYRYPDYTMETDDAGRYYFQFLTPGRYQVCAVEKAALGQPFPDRRLAFGLPAASPLDLNRGEAITNIDVLSYMPPEPFRVLQGKWTVPSWGRIDFSQPVHTVSGISIFQMLPNQAKPLTGYPDPQNPGTLIVETPESSQGTPLELNILIADPETGQADTTVLSLTIPDKPDSTGLTLLRPNKGTELRPESIRIVPLDIVFAQPAVNRDPARWGSILVDTLVFPGELAFVSPVHWQFVPEEPWAENEAYQLVLDSASWMAKNGFGFPGATLRQSFKTGRQVGFGDLSGRLEMPGKRQPAIQVRAVENPDRMFSAAVNSASEFRFTSLEERLYTLLIFDDQDHDLSYTYGSITPFRAAEWFRVLPDTVEVRANWEKELQPIIIKE